MYTRFNTYRYKRLKLIRNRLKLLKPKRQTISIWRMIWVFGCGQALAIQSIEKLEHRTVFLLEQSRRQMDPTLRIDTDQMPIEPSVMQIAPVNPVL